jgi:MtrB/PioB family decaheme-associated outer membrane protein
MRRLRRTWLIAMVLHAVGGVGVASAQVTVGGVNIEGEVEAGGRFYLQRPNQRERGKFEEYRDLTPGAVLFGLNMRLYRLDESLFAEFGGSKWGYQDQDYYLSIGRLGKWQFDVVWDQTPHIISTTSQLLAAEPTRGIFVLSLPRPLLPAHNDAPGIEEVAVRWDKALMRFGYAISPALDFSAQYSRTRKEGDKPMGVAFGSPGNNFYEVLQPIEQTVHDMRLQASYADPRFQLQFVYALSIFHNDLNRMRADNPCFGNVAPCSGGDAGGPPTGQASLPPGNMAHSLSLGGGVNLPWWRTRLNGNFAWGLHLQNESFLPHTINPALAGDPSLVLPARGLNGIVQTWLVNLSATSRPIDMLTLAAKYRFYDYSDQSQDITFPGVVLDDDALEPSRRAGRWSYRKQNADLDARMALHEMVSFTSGVGWERWDRNQHREVPVSNEYFAKFALDVTPTDWLLARLTYVPSMRRIDSYRTFAHLEHSVIDDPDGAAQAGQSVLLRKFDEADRNRHKVEGQLQFAYGTISATPTATYHDNRYINSTLGLQQETGWSAGIDFGWTPLARVAFSAGYMYEQLYQRMRSRSRPVANNVTLDFPDFDWISNLQDTVQTAYFGIKAALIPRVLDLRIDGSYATSVGRTETRNPTAPVSGDASQNLTASAKRFPAFEDSLFRLDAVLVYNITKNWAAKLGYGFETFHVNDWRTNLNPFVPNVSSIWLGNDTRDYTAHMVGLSLNYRFK